MNREEPHDSVPLKLQQYGSCGSQSHPSATTCNGLGFAMVATILSLLIVVMPRCPTDVMEALVCTMVGTAASAAGAVVQTQVPGH